MNKKQLVDKCSQDQLHQWDYNMKKLFEGLDYMDMVNQIEPHVSVDEYVAKMGDDKDIVTITFTVKSELVGNDLVEWFERGYDFILDASVSSGESKFGKWLVFVEIERKNSVPSQVIEMLKDLETLTNLHLDDWEIKVDGKMYKPNVDTLKQVVILSPYQYKNIKDKELNEMRMVANLDMKNNYNNDKMIKDMKAIAGL